MRGFRHGVQTGLQNCIAAKRTKAIAALVQALEGSADFVHAGNLALPNAKVQIALGQSTVKRVVLWACESPGPGKESAATSARVRSPPR